MRFANYGQMETIAGFRVLLSAIMFCSLCHGATIGRFESDELLSERSQINRNPLYTTWENSLEILYRFDSDLAYSDIERRLIRDSMDKITSDMKECLRFIPWDRSTHAGRDHLVIAKTFNDGARCETCFSFPGKKIRTPGATGHGQKLCLVDGSNGCLNVRESDASVRGREVMKYLVNSLGVRNELSRPDRDQFISVFPEHIQPELRQLNLTRKYEEANVLTTSPFDFNSITLPDPFKYTVPGSGPLYQPKVPMVVKSLVASLSTDDKSGLALLYPSCMVAVEERPSTTSTPTTRVTTEVPPESSTILPTSVTSTRSPTTAPPPTTPTLTTPSVTTPPSTTPQVVTTPSPETTPSVSTSTPPSSTLQSTSSGTEPTGTEQPVTEPTLTPGPEVPNTDLPSHSESPVTSSPGVEIPATDLPGQTGPPVTWGSGGEVPLTELPQHTGPTPTTSHGGGIPITSLPGQSGPPVTSGPGGESPGTDLPVVSAPTDPAFMNPERGSLLPMLLNGPVQDVVEERTKNSAATGRPLKS